MCRLRRSSPHLRSVAESLPQVGNEFIQTLRKLGDGPQVAGSGDGSRGAIYRRQEMLCCPEMPQNEYTLRF